MNRIKSILQKNSKSDEIGEEFTEDGNSRFYTSEKNLHYFLEEDNDNKKDIKDEGNIKKQSCLNLGNSERINSECEVEETD